MRKRKSPIVLVTMLALIAVGVSGYNFATSRTGGNPAEQPPAPEVADAKAVGDSRPAVSPSNISQAVKGSMTSAKPSPPSGRPDRPGSGGPMILNPAAVAKPEKPKPNPSSTSAQWYDKESALGSAKG